MLHSTKLGVLAVFFKASKKQLHQIATILRRPIGPTVRKIKNTSYKEVYTGQRIHKATF